MHSTYVSVHKKPEIPSQIEQIVLEQFLMPLVNATNSDSSSQEGEGDVQPGLRILSRQQDTKLAEFDPLQETFVLKNEAEADSEAKPGQARLVSLATKPASLSRYMKILSVIHDQARKRAFCTKRDIFYSSINVFKQQRIADSAVDNVAATLGVRREDLFVVAAPKGEVVGRIKFHSEGREIDASTNTAMIPALLDYESVRCDSATCVIVLEKDTIFSRLFQRNYHLLTKSILITGRGYPDVATRRLLSAIATKYPTLPIYGLFDADPHGMDILLSYTFGNQISTRESVQYAIPRLQWIGVKPSDTIQFPESSRSSFMPLSANDQATARRLESYEPLNVRPEWKKELQMMIQLNYKAEIEVLDSISDTFLVYEFLATRVRFC